MISLLEGMATTRAIRRFTDDPIPEADLASILWHATRAPSGSNRQPFRFLVLTDGPFATTKEVLAGYYVLNCADLDEALHHAARMPAARRGSVEVRPIMEASGE